MPSQNITNSKFDALVHDNGIVFVDFWAEWCAPCKQFAMSYEQIADQFPHVQFAKVNIEMEQELADFFEIRSIPHLMVFKQGIVIYSNAGSMPASTLKELVEQAITVDVSKIKLQDDEDSD